MCAGIGEYSTNNIFLICEERKKLLFISFCQSNKMVSTCCSRCHIHIVCYSFTFCRLFTLHFAITFHCTKIFQNMKLNFAIFNNFETIFSRFLFLTIFCFLLMFLSYSKQSTGKLLFYSTVW